MIFVSDIANSVHNEYLRTLKLKMSIFEKSYPIICEKTFFELLSLKLRKSEIEEIFMLKGEILAHELYFSSFADNGRNCRRIARQCGSLANFVYDVCEYSSKRNGFLLIYERFGKIVYYAGGDYQRIMAKTKPILAVDLCEHAYFLDYHFDKDEYLRNCIKTLDFSKLEKTDKIREKQ